MNTNTELLKCSLINEASLISQYLLRDSGFGEELVERKGITIPIFSTVLVSCVVAADPSTAKDILHYLERFASDVIDEEDAREEFSQGWQTFYILYRDLISTETDTTELMHDAVSCASILIDCGHHLRPFEWDIADLEQTVFLMQIYIKTRGSSYTTEGPEVEDLLVFALYYVSVTLSWDGLCDIFLTNVFTQQVVQKSAYPADGEHRAIHRRRCLELLVILLSTRAPFSRLFTSERAVFCYICFASELGIVDVLDIAMRAVGIDLHSLHADMHQDLVTVHKLHFAFRSAVDTTPLAYQHDMSGLRYRKTSRTCVDDVEI